MNTIQSSGLTVELDLQHIKQITTACGQRLDIKSFHNLAIKNGRLVISCTEAEHLKQPLEGDSVAIDCVKEAIRSVEGLNHTPTLRNVYIICNTMDSYLHHTKLSLNQWAQVIHRYKEGNEEAYAVQWYTGKDKNGDTYYALEPQLDFKKPLPHNFDNVIKSNLK